VAKSTGEGSCSSLAACLRGRGADSNRKIRALPALAPSAEPVHSGREEQGISRCQCLPETGT